MFTGIITDLGRVRALEQRGDLRLEMETAFDLSQVAMGASIACNGCCLTVVEKGDTWFAADVSAETLSKTTLGQWEVDDRVNLEGSLKLGEELGGHLVYGHVDGLAEITEIRPEGDSTRYRFTAPADLARFIAAKGSLALDGVSLTVNDVEGDSFGVNIVPHTAEVTTFGRYQVGDKVNLEIDMLARYVARLLKQSA
ncbi:riboflavin synthase [Rhodovibrionaceae bacterium A322]